MTYFREKYRVESTRLKGWDYRSDGSYFLTICTEDRLECFGEIVKGENRLSNMGLLVEKFWKEIPDHFDHVILDEFVVMPNHVHGIVTICGGPGDDLNVVGGGDAGGVSRGGGRDVAVLRLYGGGDAGADGVGNSDRERYSNISPKSGSLSAIIRSFKSICTREIRKNIDPQFGFQPRFHDRIIRDEGELNRIREYIKNNPGKWESDRNNPEFMW